MHTETAAQLFCRLGWKKCLNGIDNKLFAHLKEPIQARDTIELSGEEGSGKTELTLHIIIRCILPDVWNGSVVGGLSVSVIVVDTEMKFPMLRLISVLEQRLIVASEDQASSSNEPSSSNVHAKSSKNEHSMADTESFIKDCLQRLHLVTCDSSLQLLMTLHALEPLMNSNPEICVLVVDSISNYFWTDKLTGGESRGKQEEKLRTICETLQRLIDDYHLVLVMINLEIFTSQQKYKVDNEEGCNDSSNKIVQTKDKDYLCPAYKQLVKYKLKIMRESNLTVTGDAGSAYFSATVRSSSKKTENVMFTISDGGVEFL